MSIAGLDQSRQRPHRGESRDIGPSAAAQATAPVKKRRPDGTVRRGGRTGKQRRQCRPGDGVPASQDGRGTSASFGVKLAPIFFVGFYSQRRGRVFTHLECRDEALGTSAFRAFINMVHKAWLVRLSAGKAHPLVTFLAKGFFRQWFWRGHFQVHRVKWEYVCAA